MFDLDYSAYMTTSDVDFLLAGKKRRLSVPKRKTGIDRSRENKKESRSKNQLLTQQTGLQMKRTSALSSRSLNVPLGTPSAQGG